MNNIVAEDIDESYSYDCGDDYAMDTNDTVLIRIYDDEDEVYFYDGSQNSYVQFGQESEVSKGRAGGGGGGGNNNETTTYTKRCFDNNETYTAALYAYTDNNGYMTGVSAYSASYSGVYLNWYFDSSTGDFDDIDGAEDDYSNKQKDGTYTRMEVAQAAAIELIESLENIRVGLAQYDSSSSYGGAEILVDLGDVETQSETLTTAIAAIEAYGATPLAESLQDLGWYFSEAASSDLTLFDGESNEESCSAQTVFDYSINHKSDTISSSDTVIQYWCQQNFIVALTDGEPTYDNGISDKLQAYDKDEEDGTNVVQAMYDIDLRPDLSEDDGTEVINNVTTYIIGFADESATSSTLLSSMASAGGGGDFLSASNSSDLVEAFLSASQSIFAKTAAMSSISLNTTELTANSALYQANFNTAEWSGSLSAYELSDDGDVSETAAWDVADNLDALENEVSDDDDIYDRNIFTYNEDTQQGSVFNFANLSATQKSDLYAGIDLDDDGNSSSDEDDAKQLINYLYGDNSNEGSSDTTYRTRASRLGDIVNSTSIYVGTPELDWPDYSEDNKFGSSSESYSAFKTENEDRTPMVYVGSNDGMLHGFNAELTGNNAGEEQMAYIPAIIASNEDDAGLHYLADQSYAHRFYVDASPTVSDVYIDNDWRSVLIGGLRAGGKGVFALDITDPSDFTSSDDNAENLVLWEFSSKDDADFGYSYSETTVAMMANGKWAVIMGNGYNNSGTGTAQLFILFIEEGMDGTWSEGDYINIDTQVGDTTTPNGLATPTIVDSDGDSVADTIYAGDLQGNMWVFDVSDSSSAQWEVAYTSNAFPEPLFTALDSDGNAQAITTAPMITSYSSGSDLLVFFGTGKYLETTDLSTIDVMSYYSVLDGGEGGIDRGGLTSRTLITSSDDLRSITGEDLDWTASAGWYVDLTNQSSATADGTAEGERVISESTLSGDILFFNSVIPDSSSCSYGGESWFMSLDLETGLAASYAVFDANNDGVIDSDDIGYIGEKYDDGMVSSSSILGSTQYSVDSSGSLVEREVETEGSSLSGRLSWSELINEK